MTKIIEKKSENQEILNAIEKVEKMPATAKKYTFNKTLLGVYKGDADARQRLTTYITVLKNKVDLAIEKAIEDGSIAKEIENKIFNEKKKKFIDNIFNDYILN